MKNDRFVQSLNRIEPDETTQEHMLNQILSRKLSAGSRKSHRKKLALAVACLLLLAVAASAIPGLISIGTAGNGGIDGSGGQGGVSLGESNSPGPLDETINSHCAVHVPAMELQENTQGPVMEMIAFFVYQGRVYTQAHVYFNDEASAIDRLVGEHVGHAKGNINEWSTQDEYATEFAGSVTGDVYAVKGYDPGFRLCMEGSYTDDNGKAVRFIEFYENLEGIELATGSSLFGESRLKLAGNWSRIEYQTHDDWNYGSNDFKSLANIPNGDIAAFMDALYANEFEDTYETAGIDFYLPEAPKQAHVYFFMNDGTCIELRLFEGGYVGYRPLGWYFVKMPGAAFDSIFNACQGESPATHISRRPKQGGMPARRRIQQSSGE